MRFDCGESESEKYERLINWHRYFAWWPVVVSNHDCRWLEVVERRGRAGMSYEEWKWEYKALDKG